MVQTRSEERRDTHEQELNKIPVMEEKLTVMSQNMENLQAQVEKTHQMVMIFMERMAKERVLASGKQIDSSAQETWTGKSAEGESSARKETKNDTMEKKGDGDGDNNDRNKFNKVEMSVFNGDDPDSWLFRADRYFQIHKLTNSENSRSLQSVLKAPHSTGIDRRRRETNLLVG